MYFNIAIDSMSVLTPLGSFSYINESHFDEVIEVNLDTSEILSSGQKPIYYKKYGITIRSFVVNLFGKRYLNVTMSSKLLQKDYFVGIDRVTFRACFDFCKKVFDFDIDYYKYINNSIVMDCDFKADFYKTNKEFHDICKFYSVFPSAKVYYTTREHFLDEKVISGLQFVNRNDASIRSPFIKFYSKAHELLGKSIEFYENFLTLKREYMHNLRRVEVTIKNKQHFESFRCVREHAKRVESSVNSLQSVLSLSTTDIMDIINSCIERYSIMRVEDIKPVEEVVKVPYTATDFLVIRSFELLMTEGGYTLNQLLNLLEEYPALNANTKSRIRKRIKHGFLEYQKLRGIRSLIVDVKDAFYEKD